MTIQKLPKKIEKIKENALNNFINLAPDSQSKKSGVMKGKKQQITVTISPDIIEQLDKKAEDTGLSRAALINIGIRHVLNEGAKVGGKNN